MKRKIIWIVLVGIVAGSLYFYFNSREAKKAAAGPRFEAHTVARGDIEVSTQSTASVRPQNRLQIKPPVAGRIEQVLANEGDEVKAGQTIALMSSSDRAAVLDAARARGADALARWNDIYKATPVIAPLDGTIIARSIEPGQTVNAADDLFVLSDVLIVEAQVDETDLGSVKTGQVCRIVIDAYPERPFPGRVSHIAYEAQTVQNVTIYAVEVMPDEIPVFMRSGMTANVTFLSQRVQDVVCVPVESVQEADGAKTVRVGDPRKPDAGSAISITTGISDGRMIEVTTGLSGGEVILIPKIVSGQLGDAKSNPFMPWRRGSGMSGSRR